MGSNIDYGRQENLIPFNCYRSFANEKGRLVKEKVAFDRIYCNVADVSRSRSNINNSVRAISWSATFTTNSQHELEEDYYLENMLTGEVWKIDSITINPINNSSYETSVRPQLMTRMVCSR